MPIFSDERGNLKLVNFVVKKPCCSCCSVIGMCLLMTTILILIVGDAGVPITEETNSYDVDDQRSLDYDSYMLAKKQTVEAREAINAANEDPQLTQSENMDIVYWIYEAENSKGMFSPEALKDMRDSEGIFQDRPDWRSYCQLQLQGGAINASDAKCNTVTAVKIFYAESWNLTLVQSVIDRLAVKANIDMYNKFAPCLEFSFKCDDFNAASAQDQQFARELKQDLKSITSKWNGEGSQVSDTALVSLLCAYMKLLPTQSFYVDFFFDKEFSVQNPVSMHSRSILFFGGPREGYKRIDEKPDEQGAEVKKYVIDNLYDEMEKAASLDHSPVSNSFYFMTQLIFDVFLTILFTDSIAAVGSVLMVFFYLWYMLGSLFLASVGMAEILLSIPCAWFLFRGICQIQYFAGLNMLTIFIICAIGADDIFVFMDTYKASAHMGPEVNKDLETRMSYVWRKSGLAMAITSATTCMAFLSTLLSPIAGTRSFGLFAALVVFWDYVLVMSLFCTSVVIYHNRFEAKPPLCKLPLCCGCCVKGCDCKVQTPTPTEKIMEIENSEVKEREELKQDRITNLFSTKVTDFVLSPKARIGLAVFFVALLVPMIYMTTELEPTKEAEQFLDSDHSLQYSITLLNTKFPTSSEDRGLRVYYSWGLNQVDRDGVNQLLDPTFIGKPSFKSSFSFSPQCQAKMIEVCDDLTYDNSPERLKLIKRTDTGFSEVKCVVPSFLAQAKTKGLATNETGQYLVPQSNLDAALRDYVDFPPKLENVEEYIDQLGWDGKKMKYITVQVESQDLDRWSSLPEEDVMVVYNNFINLGKHLDGIVGDACGATGVLMTDLDQKFIFMNNQKIYRTSAVTGALLGVGLAFIVILIATRSIMLAFFSIISITCTIVCVIGTTTAMGWTLGTVEAILISILAGFSVDYVVHLAHAYAGARGTNADRVRHAFGEMGTPVLSGMLTSVLASLPLFTCQIVFFSKFGSFLCFTILFSWTFANFFFMSLLATFGKARYADDSERVTVKEKESLELKPLKKKPSDADQDQNNAGSTQKMAVAEETATP